MFDSDEISERLTNRLIRKKTAELGEIEENQKDDNIFEKFYHCIYHHSCDYCFVSESIMRRQQSGFRISA